MFRKIKIIFIQILFVFVVGATMYACANQASPTGGRYDEEPPKVRKSTPSFNALNVQNNKVEIVFDENIKIEKPMEKVIIAPPQQNFPIVKSIGHKAVVELKDELLPNTTYTIDFTDAIVDNNEGNPLENFSIAFSTGETLDSLQISGYVLTAENLEPVKGIYVGIHANLDDTAFTRTPFERISRTNSRGFFSIKNIAKGRYRIFALNDLNRNYTYDNPQEDIAFNDSIIIPDFVAAIRQDTIFKDSLTIDTIKTINYTRFLPDNIVLRSFLSDFKRQYLQKHTRPEEKKLELYFAAPTQFPKFNLIKPLRIKHDWYVKEQNATNDSISLWITDSLVYQCDSIEMGINYLRTDTLNRHVWITDTLRFNYKPPKKNVRKRKDKNEESGTDFLRINTNLKGTMDVYQSILLEFEQPLLALDSVDIKLMYLQDSLSIPVDYSIKRDTLNIRKYMLWKKWEPGASYLFKIDSAAFLSQYGKWNDRVEQKFTVKKLEEYGNLAFVLSGLPEGKTVYVELLDKLDKPFRKAKVKDGTVLFWDLNPGTIYARAFVDDNEDGMWTTGDYEKKRKPERVFYYPKSYEIRAFTDHEEPWNVNDVPHVKQKPLDITKNKPEEKKRKKMNRQNQERNRSGQSIDRGVQGLGKIRQSIR